MREVKSGIFLPTFWSAYGSRGIVQSMVDVAAAARTLGFDSLWACDHIISKEPNAGTARCLEPLILMAWLAEQFPELVMGTDVLVLPQRNALVVAKQVATLSALTRGRFILGTGVGWYEDEFRLLGADFQRRGEHADEAVAMMRKLWRQKQTSIDGAFYHFDDAYFYSQLEGDCPPIWVGGFSQSAVKRAARYGDGWMPFWGSWKPFARDLELFRARVQTLRSSERGEALSIAANVPLHIRVGSNEPATDHSQTVEEALATLQAYHHAGLETVIWNIQSQDLDDYIQQMRLVSEQIMPYI